MSSSSHVQDDWASVFRNVALTWRAGERSVRVRRVLFAAWSVSLLSGIVVLYLMLEKQRREAIEMIRAQEALSMEAVARLAEQQELIEALRRRFELEVREQLATKADSGAVNGRFQHVEMELAMRATQVELMRQVATRVTPRQLDARAAALRAHADTLAGGLRAALATNAAKVEAQLNRRRTSATGGSWRSPAGSATTWTGG
jgi:hypothetical protein